MCQELQSAATRRSGLRSSGRGGKANWVSQAATTVLLLTYNIGREGEHPKGKSRMHVSTMGEGEVLTAGNKGRSGG